jgi:hypothetical protein
MPYYVGLDLGQSADYTALAIVHDTFVEPIPGYRTEQLQVVHLERYPLRTSYVDIVTHVHELLKKPELHPWEEGKHSYHRQQTHPTLIVDRTGVGAPVTDLFTKRRVPFVQVTITGGTSVSRGEGRRHYNVPKRDLVSSLEVPFHNQQLVIAQELDLRPTLEKELAGFKRKIKLTTGHDSYEHWREGDHDDLVLATALAVWWARRRPTGTRVLKVDGKPHRFDAFLRSRGRL